MVIKVSGVAVPYKVPARINWDDDHWTAFAPGAFSASIAEYKSASCIEARWNHRRGALARRDRGEIGLVETSAGLLVTIEIDHPSWADLMVTAARQGQLRGFSIGWDRETVCQVMDGNTHVITKADLIEVSIIAWDMRPKFPGTVAHISILNTA